MKKIFYISIIALTALSTVGCVEETVYEFDHTLTAYYLYRDVEQAVGATACTATHAFILSSYMDATTDAERQRIEDKYYKYYKIRNDEAGTWKVYGSDGYSEEYYVSDNKSLTQTNASWLVYRCSDIYGSNRFDSSEIIIRRTELGTYKVIFSNAPIGTLRYGYDYYSGGKEESRYFLSGEFNLVTDFFSASGQEIDNAGFSLTGTAVMTDSHNPNFSLGVDISTPLKLKVSLKEIAYGVNSGKLNITVAEQLDGIHETIAVDHTPGGQTFSLRYTTADGTFDGTYTK